MSKAEEFERLSGLSEGYSCLPPVGDNCPSHNQSTMECLPSKNEKRLAAFVAENRDLIARALRVQEAIENPPLELLEQIEDETGVGELAIIAVFSALQEAVK
jgi:hypothetical protein